MSIHQESPYHGFASSFRRDDFDPRQKGNDRIDENAVRRMGYLMLSKMKHHADKGRSGWFNKGEHVDANLVDMMLKAQAEEDWITVANCAMMLQIRKELKHGQTPTPATMPSSFMRGQI